MLTGASEPQTERKCAINLVHTTFTSLYIIYSQKCTFSVPKRRHSGLEKHEVSKCQNVHSIPLTHNRVSLQESFRNVNIMLEAKKKKNQAIFEISKVLFQFEVLHICDVNAHAAISGKIIITRSLENQDN